MAFLADVTSIVWTTWAMSPDRAELARESLASLYLSVAHLPVEIIVVDNGGGPGVSHHFLEEAEKGRVTTYIRNATNMSFGVARNQGLWESIGGIVGIVDNDIIFKKGWLEACLAPFAEFPTEKIITSPFDYTDQRPAYKRPNLGYYRRNARAGSNCFLMRRETLLEVGYFKVHRIAGSLFTDALVRAGYSTVIAGEGLARDAGLRVGYDHKAAIVCHKVLTDGSIIDYTQKV